MGVLFGTDGIRGLANAGPVTPEIIVRLGRAIVGVCPDRSRPPRILIGRDTRRSGTMIESALAAGIASAGGDVVSAGIVPTPAVAFLGRDRGCAAAAAVSASHNPYQDNGIKLFSRDGFKLSDAEEKAIETRVLEEKGAGPFPTGAGVGVCEEDPEASDRYCDFCRGTWPLETDLEGMKLVLDCGHGATFRCAPQVFRGLKADVVVINDRPDGVNINAACGSQYTEALKKAVVSLGADAGLAFDGDGDRLIAVDETGAELTGDHALVVCARLYRDLGRLNGNLVVSTVMSNFGLDEALGKLGVVREETAVGDRYVLETMRERGAAIGAEASGHMIFLDRHTTGDGIVSGLQLLAAVRRFGEPLSRLASEMRMYPQALVNVEVARKPPLEDLPELTAAAAAAEAELSGRGRVLIRYSGTQNLCRVMVEGPDRETTERTVRSLARLAEKLLS